MNEFLKSIMIVKILIATVKHGLNLRATLKLNKVLFDKKTASKLPIFVFGKLKISTDNAMGVIEAPIKIGMIRIGYNFDSLFCDKGGGVIQISNGRIIFRGAVVISTKVSISINGGELDFGNCSVIGCGTHIQSRKRVVIGDGCRVSQFVVVLDTNIHYMRDVETGRIARRDATTIIGNYCWVGMRCRVMKGSVLPDYSIVAAGSLINKDMSRDTLPYPTFAGAPAKMVSSGKVRVFDLGHEARINSYFQNHEEASSLDDITGLVDEELPNAIQFDYNKYPSAQ